MNMYRVVDLHVLALTGGREEGCFHTMDSNLVSGSYKLIYVSSVVIILFKNLSPSRAYLFRNVSDTETRAAFSSVDKSLGTHLALTFDQLSSFFRLLWTVVGLSWALLLMSFTVRRLSSLSKFFTAATVFSDITTGLPLLFKFQTSLLTL